MSLSGIIHHSHFLIVELKLFGDKTGEPEFETLLLERGITACQDLQCDNSRILTQRITISKIWNCFSIFTNFKGRQNGPQISYPVSSLN